jgi:small redox-active disulfide protein 2
LLIKILGTGCVRCNALENGLKEAIKELGIDATIEHVRDIRKIMEYQILATPGLVIDEKLVLAGKVPTKAEMTKLLAAALAK